jgi:hypothetical protein
MIERYFEATVYAEIDIDLINRVLVNLLTNAIKYSPMNSQIKIHLTTNQQVAKVGIKDEGIGIAPEKQALVFHKFVQLEAKKLGDMRSSGLGLAFCKMAMEAHTGEIGLLSQEGHGAEFWFTLPLANQETLVSETIPTSPTHQKMLSEQDKQHLISYLPALKELQVYYSTALEEELSKISFNSDALRDWEMRLQNAIFAMNQELYEQILAEAS